MLEAQFKEKFNNLTESMLRVVGVSLLLSVFVLLSSCESAIAPPADIAGGTIKGSIRYVGAWPPADSVRDLRFVALRFVPIDTTDFLQLNRMEVSRPLTYGVDADSFEIQDVQPGIFPYSGVARQLTNNLFSWAPVALVTDNDGIIIVEESETISLSILVDFDNIPPFPKLGGESARHSGLEHVDE